MLNAHIEFRKQGRVYVKDEAGTVDYSDGSDVERYLREVLENAGDLSSHSIELERAIRDWPSEYHLSSRRANLLRPFTFEPGARVLELGCGCGAISRFLGEQGLLVDAVEGSFARAELAALRCRDLDNVSVYCANFNKLDLPGNAYDLICLVGVAEYAARFMEEGQGEPVVRLLNNLSRSLRPGGVVALAIENRTGMKYVLGAHEDHYARRFVGINDYFGVRDINTYTLPEWQRLFAASGVRESRVYLPFPDYKLPTVILSRDFVTDNPHAFCNLEGVPSRDYVDTFESETRESLFWQSAAASNSLDRYSNSFLFLLDMTGGGIGDAYAFDFAHLPGFSRRRECCLLTVKPEGEDIVERSKLVAERFTDPYVAQRVVNEPYRRGTLLSVLWSRALEIEPDTDRFVRLVKDYLAFVEGRDDPSIDLTPFNIVVDEQGRYHPFDEEWVTAEPVSSRFLLFRSLAILAVTAGRAIRPYAKLADLKTVREFIADTGERAGVDLARDMDAYADEEEKFQSAIAVERPGNPTRALLDKSIKNVVPVRMRLYWRMARQPYTEAQSRQALVDNWDDRQRVTIPLPPAAAEAARIRFNPIEKIRDDGVGFLRLYNMEVTAVDPDTGDRTVVWSMRGSDEIAQYAALKGIRYGASGLGSVFMATADDPELDFQFVPRIKLSERHALEFSVDMRIARSPEYLLARDLYLSTQARLENRLEELDGLEASYRRTRDELDAIKHSGFWRVFEGYRAVRARLDALGGKLALWAALTRNLGWKRTAARAWGRGARRLQTAIGRRPESAGPPTRYEIWRDLHLRRRDDAPADGPLISVVMPVHNAPRAILARAITSVKEQTYRHWELCIADDASDNPETRAVLDGLDGDRIKLVRLSENRNISGATNAAAELASGAYLAFMDNDDELADDALAEVAAAIAATGADCLYTDEDFIRTDGHLDYPHFKPDYNPDLLLSHNYITHLLVLKRELFDEAGKLRTEYDGAQDYDLLLRVVERAQRIEHIPRPLYHWRMSERSTSLNPTIKPEGHRNARRALEDALRRRRIEARVEETRLPHYFRVQRTIAGSPRVSIIIPFRDKPELLRQCVTAILDRTTYPELELIGISNDSWSPRTYDEMESLRRLDERVHFFELNEEFNFSRLVNDGVNRASGEHVLLLNNDIEIITPDWIQGLLEHSQRPEVAAVGGKLYYPNNTVQHAGIAVGLGGYAGHPHQRSRATAPGYFNRLHVIQNVSAVTGAMMMVQRTKFLDLGGFDEERFGIAYNDVDFCLRAMEAGFLNVFTPYVEAYHRESASRGYEDTPAKNARFAREKENLLARHGEAIRKGDPYYNPNFDQSRDDFRFFVEPAREAKVQQWTSA